MRAAKSETRNGTFVAAICFAALGGFFVYQWWLNPTRAVQRRLNEIAATLSVPDGEPSAVRATRAARLRKYLAEGIRVTAPSVQWTTRNAVVAAVGSVDAPAGGWNVQFVDVQIRVNHATNADADAYMTIELNGRDVRTGQPTIETRDAAVTLKKQEGEWVVATADVK